MEELYGDSKEESWKAGEVLRLKQEQGIAVVEEPSLAEQAGGFRLNQQA